QPVLRGVGAAARRAAGNAPKADHDAIAGPAQPMTRRRPPMPGRSIVRALAHRNFRLFFVGQALSLIGTWTQSTAMPWLVTALTDSKTLLGVVAFSSQLPSFFLPPLAGV